MRNESVDEPDLQDMVNSVNGALSTWEEIRTKLHALFGAKIEQCGLTLTPAGVQLRDEILGEKNAVVSVIDSFVDRFKELADMPKDQRNESLLRFWTAADRLHEALSGMALRRESSSSYFGGFVTPTGMVKTE